MADRTTLPDPADIVRDEARERALIAGQYAQRVVAAEARVTELEGLLTLMRKRRGDFELPNYWKGEIDAALAKEDTDE